METELGMRLNRTATETEIELSMHLNATRAYVETLRDLGVTWSRRRDTKDAA